ncbi:hypothetical protein SCP_0101700 [Sparassis crispa]|uniref:ABC transporter domain-containing protein n=1 Tax=Sparassis crispa TaxID=139825 RepID=A0A401G556_9APHY|nr:hypothetical protein SCP_0101700 [Sparassis crispa]GBE77297.1 hypothetical protein SCP_0101700 [Sparassis crispa]
MPPLFFRQLSALVWKNWIVLSKHPFLNLVRCLLLPVGYGVFMALAQLLLAKVNNYGLGTLAPVHNLTDVFDGSLSLIWVDSTNGTGTPSAVDIMSHVTRGFSPKQLDAVQQLDSPSEIPKACPENFRLYSQCFGAVVFNALPGMPNGTTATTDPEQAPPFNYTIRADGGLFYINVDKHTSDFEKKLFPLQWAVDSAIIELTTGVQPLTPMEWPFSQITNTQQSTNIRLSYIRGIRELLVLALFICYVPVAYHLPGSFMGERANLLTSHLKAMGLLDSARIISWYFSVVLAYLPAWIAVAVIWHFCIFKATNPGLVIAIHLLIGLSLAGWSLFVAVPFGKSPQLAAVASTFSAIGLAVVALVFARVTTNSILGTVVFSVVFPPGFYVFAIYALCGFENHNMAATLLHADPDNQILLYPLIIAASVNIFLWPCLAVLFERLLYDAHGWSSQSKRSFAYGMHPDTAISIRNLGKDFHSSIFTWKKDVVTAVADLSLDIPRYGIHVLLGSNGAGKSTTMSILAGLLGRTRGTVLFDGGVSLPPRGTIGIVPQKNVLFPELTCLQTLRVWQAVKTPSGSACRQDSIEWLLRDCDLEKKIHYNADSLSGGQKRRLQLAIGLIGGSQTVLIDECTSGVDPLSRRAIWKILNAVRHDRTIVFTTHFLDEANLLADTIAILKAPGRLVAHGTPVSLKSTLGEGYTMQVQFAQNHSTASLDFTKYPALDDLLDRIRPLAPLTYTTSSVPNETSYHLRSKDVKVVQQVLELVEEESSEFGIKSYSVHGTSLEDIFLGLMYDDMRSEDMEKETFLDSRSSSFVFTLKPPPILDLTDGRQRSAISQAFTVFHKRTIIARRSWLTPLLAVAVAAAGSCIPLLFLADRTETCLTQYRSTYQVPLYFPHSPIPYSVESSTLPGEQLLVSPPDILSVVGPSTAQIPMLNIPDNATFIDHINRNYLNMSLGGVSADLQNGSVTVAWEATEPGFMGLVMLNLASNLLFNNAAKTTGVSYGVPVLIAPQYESLPGPNFNTGTFIVLKWVAFFGASMAAFPAFFSLYVSNERRSSVQAMQFSNGLSNPVGLWLGHLLFDAIFAVLAVSIITVVFATASNQFNGLGFLWLVFVLYGIAAVLFSYCTSLLVASPLAAFALSAGYQVVAFLLYFAANLLSLTYAPTSRGSEDLTIVHFTMSVLAPITSLLRASFVSVNLFSLLCNGNTPVTTSSMGDILHYGGPILYLIIYTFVLFAILVFVDSGSLVKRKDKRNRSMPEGLLDDNDVQEEANFVASSADPLRVLNVSKTYGTSKVVDDVSMGVPKDTIFALLGPNGAGKTTTFNMIRGDLTVEEHLQHYGRLKGLYRGDELRWNVDCLLQATSLHMYADRLASKLSGGNQRKLALAIALIGNPSVVLIDEFSTGVDAKMKRDMWATLRKVAVGKAIVITTHSMEEASALATKVGILAKKMLAIGTTESLAARYATYEVHFSCRTREEIMLAQELMAQIPGARMADDVATRFEIPIGNDMSLAELFAVLSSQSTFSEYTVERATLESVFLKVIRENAVREEDGESKRLWWTA